MSRWWEVRLYRNGTHKQSEGCDFTQFVSSDTRTILQHLIRTVPHFCVEKENMFLRTCHTLRFITSFPLPLSILLLLFTPFFPSLSLPLRWEHAIELLEQCHYTLITQDRELELDQESVLRLVPCRSVPCHRSIA